MEKIDKQLILRGREVDEYNKIKNNYDKELEKAIKKDTEIIKGTNKLKVIEYVITGIVITTILLMFAYIFFKNYTCSVM